MRNRVGFCLPFVVSGMIEYKINLMKILFFFIKLVNRILCKRGRGISFVCALEPVGFRTMPDRDVTRGK